jgi:hypothetical protein
MYIPPNNKLWTLVSREAKCVHRLINGDIISYDGPSTTIDEPLARGVLDQHYRFTPSICRLSDMLCEPGVVPFEYEVHLPSGHDHAVGGCCAVCE